MGMNTPNPANPWCTWVGWYPFDTPNLLKENRCADEWLFLFCCEYELFVSCYLFHCAENLQSCFSSLIFFLTFHFGTRITWFLPFFSFFLTSTNTPHLRPRIILEVGRRDVKSLRIRELCEIASPSDVKSHNHDGSPAWQVKLEVNKDRPMDMPKWMGTASKATTPSPRTTGT